MSLRRDATIAAPVAFSMGGGGGGEGKVVPRMLGAGCAGVAELLIFHPVDTVAKRMMSNQLSVAEAGGYGAIIFRDAAQSSFFARWASLFPGLGFGGAYKILQRVYKFGGQVRFSPMACSAARPISPASRAHRRFRRRAHSRAGPFGWLGWGVLERAAAVRRSHSGPPPSSAARSRS